MKKEKVIYNDSLYDYIENNKSDIIEFLNEEGVDPTPNAIEDAAANMIDDDALYLADLIKNFDKKIKYKKIVVVGVLGLWYGKRAVKAKFNDLHHAFYKCIEDTNKAYFIANSTLQLDAIHHDGINKFKFYKVVNGKQYAIKFDEFMNY